MDEYRFKDAGCSCHLSAPCSKCMATCPDCSSYIDEEGYCSTCNETNVNFVLDVLEKLHQRLISSERGVSFSYMVSELFRETEIAINILKERK